MHNEQYESIRKGQLDPRGLQEKLPAQQRDWDRQANQTMPFASGITGGIIGQCPQPKEPSLLTCAQELFGYLHDLASAQREARARIFMPEPCDRPDTGECRPNPESLEAILRQSCQLAANLVGEARTINAKLLG